MKVLIEQTKDWIRIAKDLTEDEAIAYGQIVRNQQILNERKDAKYIKAMEKLDEKENYILEYKIIDTWENEKI